MERLTTARPVRWLAIVAWCLIASGMPLPAVREGDERAPAKDRSRPFPCMDSPCGCATADQCFSSCCCHSPAERLAWARAHGVDVGVLTALEHLASAGPGSAAPAADGAAANGGPTHGSPDGSHAARCCEATGESCCQSPTTRTAVGRSCNGKSRQAAETIAAPCSPDPAANTVLAGETSRAGADSSRTGSGAQGPCPAGGGIILRAMLACHGVVPGLGSGAVPLPASVIGWWDDCSPWGNVPTIDDEATGHAARPEVPPPRRVAA